MMFGRSGWTALVGSEHMGSTCSVGETQNVYEYCFASLEPDNHSATIWWLRHIRSKDWLQFFWSSTVLLLFCNVPFKNVMISEATPLQVSLWVHRYGLYRTWWPGTAVKDLFAVWLCRKKKAHSLDFFNLDLVLSLWRCCRRSLGGFTPSRIFSGGL